MFRIAPVYLLAIIGLFAIVAGHSWSADGLQLKVSLPRLLGEVASWLALGADPRPDLNGFRDTRHLLAGVTWTLQAEWLFYASLPVLALATRRGRTGLALVLPVVGLVATIAALLASGSPPLPACLGPFFAGMGCAAWPEARRPPSWLASLLTEEEQNEFHRFSEKVINRSFQFQPTAAEAALIGFPKNDALSKELRDACEALGIVNIRVMARLEAYACQLHEILAGLDIEFIASVTRALSVIVWVALSPEGEGAPTLAYLLDKREKQFLGIENVSTTEEEDQWGKVLTDFGFGSCDEVDRFMIEDVSNGFFNEARLQNAVQTYTVDATAARARDALTAAWQPFHASFKADEQEVADAIYNGHLGNILYLTPNNLSSAVTVLKDTGFPDKASALLETFMSVRSTEDIFDREDDVFGTEIRDPDVIKAFDEQMKLKGSMLPPPKEAAERLYKGGWSQKDEASLQQLTVDDFVEFFESEADRLRSNFIAGCLTFRKIANASPRTKGDCQKSRSRPRKDRPA